MVVAKKGIFSLDENSMKNYREGFTTNLVLFFTYPSLLSSLYDIL